MKYKSLTICIFALLLVAACKEPIVHNLSETEANRLLTKLQDIAVDSDKQRQADGKWSIRVEGQDTLRAIKYLTDTRMLREENPALANSSSMLSSREDQRFKFERALSQEIEYTLATIEGVLEARVHLNLPARDPLFGQPLDEGAKGGASVLINAKPDFGISEEQIKSLVAGASGIESSFISVLITKNQSEVNANKESLPEQTIQAHSASEPEEPVVSANVIYPSSSSGLSFASISVQIGISLILLGLGLLYGVRSYRKKRSKKLADIATNLNLAGNGYDKA